ncbi:MAG: hypothetical protein R3F23_06570 [Verrucomicrobiia bacterium]
MTSIFKRGWVSVIIVFLIAFVASFFYAQAPSMGDDIDYYGFALHRHFPRSEFPPDDGFHFLRWPVWGLIWFYQFLGGYGWGSFLFVPFFCLAVACAIAFFVGKELEGPGVGVLAALLVFFHPLMDPLITRPMPDVMECALGGLGFLMVWRFLFGAEKRSRLAGLGYGMGLGVLIFVTWANRPTGLIWVIAVGLLSLLRWREVGWFWFFALATFTLCFFVEAWIYQNLFGDFWHSWHANLKATGRKGTEAIAFWKLPFRFFDTFAAGGALKLPYFLLTLVGCWMVWLQGKKGKWVVSWFILIYLGVSCAVQSIFPLRPLVRDGARFLGAVALPAGILAAFGLRGIWNFALKRGNLFLRRGMKNGAVIGLVLLLFLASSRNRWNPDYLPELRAWFKQIQPGEKIKTHGNFYEVAFIADAKKARQLTWFIFDRGQLAKEPDLLNPNQEGGLDHLLLHRPRVMVTVRKSLEKGKVFSEGQLARDLLSADSRWQLQDVLFRSSETILGGWPEFFWFRPTQASHFPMDITTYASELSWTENPDSEYEKNFFEKKGSGKLFFEEGEGLVFERNAPGKVIYLLTRAIRLPEEWKGRVLDLRVNTVSQKVEALVNYVKFLDAKGQEIETQEIEFFAAPNGFWDFSAVKIPSDAVLVQWKIAVSGSCQRFVLKEIKLLSE